MTGEWTSVRLGDVAKAHKKSFNPIRMGDAQVDLYSLPAFDQGRAPHRVTADNIRSNKLEVPKGAVLVSRLNPHIPRIWAPRIDEQVHSVCSTEFAVLTAERCEVDFLPYFIASDAIYGRLNESVTGTSSSHQRVSLKRLLDMCALLPPLPVQRRVSEVLRAVDDRIEALQGLSSTLGDLVISACEAAIAERSSTDSIPLPRANRLINGGAFTKGASGTGRMVIRIRELNSGASESTVYNDIQVPGEKTAFPGDILFAWSGSLGVWRWFGDEAIVNQHIFKVLPGEHPVWLGWFHILNELDTYRDIASGKATTMGHITKDHLNRTMVPTLSPYELETLTQVVQPAWDHQLAIQKQRSALEELRGFLLPRLVSGELRVREAEELVQEAT